MSSTKLPKSISDFFERTTRKFTELYKPDWLFNELDDPVWIIKSGNDIRYVAGVLRGGVRLHWEQILPNGSLVDSQHTLILEQAKMLLVLAHDGSLPSVAKSLRTIIHFHLYLLWFIEFLIIRHGERFHEIGFEVVTIDNAVEFLEAAEDAGVCGTGAYVQRWEKYLSQAINGSMDRIEDSIAYLMNNGAYGQNGKLKIRFVADAIGIESKRLNSSPIFKAYISKFNLLPATSYELHTESPRAIRGLATWVASFFYVLAVAPIRSGHELADTQLVMDVVRPFRSSSDARTKTMPLSVGKQLISGCCNWMVDIYPSMKDYLNSISDMSLEIMSDREISHFRAIAASQSIINLPSKLHTIMDVYRKWQSDFKDGAAKAGSQIPFPVFLFRLHTGVCFVLVTLLSCCRRAEAIEISSKASQEANGRFYMSVLLRKTGIDIFREKMDKPVPRLVHECLVSLDELKSLWEQVVNSDDPLTRERAFFKVNVRGMYPMTVSDSYIVLNELSDFLRLEDSFGKHWVVLPHQLRRYFAMTFFHFGGAENALPTLTWFMGHDNIEETWRYVKESLTGKEISASEASMATSAICSDDQSDGAQKLRSIVLEHFGCDNITVMHEDEIQDYLELLAEEGVFTARPIQIFCGKHQRYTVLISIKEGVCASSK